MEFDHGEAYCLNFDWGPFSSINYQIKQQMNPLQRSPSKKGTVQRRESSEGFLHMQLKDELSTLKLPQTKRVEAVNELMAMRVEQLQSEMCLMELERQADRSFQWGKFEMLVTSMENQNKSLRKRLELLRRQETRGQEMGEEWGDCNLNKREEEIEEQGEQKRIMENQLKRIEKSIQVLRVQCEEVQDHLIHLDKKVPAIELKHRHNSQALYSIVQQNQEIKQALLEERQWQDQQKKKMQLVQQQKYENVKQHLEELCQQEDRIHLLQQQLAQTELQIQQLDEQISMKFHKIEECAEFLDELDDFDKLTLIFVYDSPEQFALDEIYQQAQKQLRMPKNRIQLAYSEQEYIDRARFSSVSSRMKIFFHFHQNKLDHSIDSLIQVFRKLQFQDMTLGNRYTDLLEEQERLEDQLDQLKSLSFHTLPDTDERIPNELEIDESNYEAIECLTQANIRHLGDLKHFFVRIYLMLTGVLMRIVNALQSIKEVLKSCPQEQFDEIFYLKWTFNRLYQKLSATEQELEQKFHIKLVAKDSTLRNSNQLLNAIYDHLEVRQQRRTTLSQTDQQELSLKTLAPHLNYEARKEVEFHMNHDIFLQQFLTMSELQLLLQAHGPLEKDHLIELVLTEGYTAAHQYLQAQLQHLFQFIQEAINDCRNMNAQSSSATKLSQRYNLKDLIDKHTGNYEYKQRPWKQEVLEKRLEQIKLVNGYFNEGPLNSNQQTLPDMFKTPQNGQKQATTPSLRSTTQSKTTRYTVQSKASTEVTMKRYLNQLDLHIPKANISKQAELHAHPIVVHLHQMQRKIQNEKVKSTFEGLKDVNFSHPIELSSKKSIDGSVQNLGFLQQQQQLGAFPPLIELGASVKKRGKCPRVPSIKPMKLKQRTQQAEMTQKTEPTTNSLSEINTVYSTSNKFLQTFFRVPTTKK